MTAPETQPCRQGGKCDGNRKSPSGPVRLQRISDIGAQIARRFRSGNGRGASPARLDGTLSQSAGSLREKRKWVMSAEKNIPQVHST